MKSALRRPLLAAATAAAAATATAVVAPAAPAAAAPDELAATAALREAVTVEGIAEHLRALQDVADRNGGTRASGRSGYDASLDYVQGRLEAAGYAVTRDPFDFAYFEQTGPSTLQRVSPDPVTFGPADFTLMTYSGAGDVTSTVTGVDLSLDDPAASTSGCQTSDFAGFPAGHIALVQRGACTFGTKVGNAQQAGAVAVVVVNSGATGATGTFAGTLGGPYSIPAVGARTSLAQELLGTTTRLVTQTVSEIKTTENLLADLEPFGGGQGKGDGRGSDVVLVGAHLDSVLAGPGINDNGTGSATVLEIAEQMAAARKQVANGDGATGAGTRSTVRFAWWGAEELGLLGSEAYVAELAEERPQELERIKLNLNFDMVGSPNYARFVYDGDASAKLAGSAPAPAGSAEIERVFVDYFDGVGLTSAPTAFSGRSDYGPFIEPGVDIPAGGLFTGAEGIKTERQQQLFGGQAGVAFDVCYHQACDTLANVNLSGLDEMSDAAAHATMTFALRNLRAGLTDPQGPVGATAGDLSGGGLREGHDHDHDGATE